MSLPIFGNQVIMLEVKNVSKEFKTIRAVDNLSFSVDNGEIVGFDASTYLMNHKKRTIAAPNITMEKARESVKIDYDIDSIRLAIIPKNGEEILCYEFKGKYKDSDFIVYINALNGKEEDVLQIIKNENGILTF